MWMLLSLEWQYDCRFYGFSTLSRSMVSSMARLIKPFTLSPRLSAWDLI